MELANIEKLLEAYFEGTTSLFEERALKSFFTEEEVPVHLEVYKPLFVAMHLAKEETSQRSFDSLVLTTASKEEPKKSKFWILSIAASFLILVGALGFIFTKSGLSSEEKEALAAFKKTQETMLLLSESLNQGTASIAHFDEFNKGVSSIQLLEQFNESKNLILK